MKLELQFGDRIFIKNIGMPSGYTSYFIKYGSNKNTVVCVASSDIEKYLKGKAFNTEQIDEFTIQYLERGHPHLETILPLKF